MPTYRLGLEEDDVVAGVNGGALGRQPAARVEQRQVPGVNAKCLRAREREGRQGCGSVERQPDNRLEAWSLCVGELQGHKGARLGW